MCELIRDAGGDVRAGRLARATARGRRAARVARRRPRADGPLLRPLRRAAARSARAVGVATVRARDPGRVPVRPWGRRRQGPAVPAARRPHASSPGPVSFRSTCASRATARRNRAAIRSSSSSQADERGGGRRGDLRQRDDRPRLPAFNIATRGIAYFHVTLRTGERDLHSGLYGGAALNAAHALIKTLGAVDRGRRPPGRAAAPGDPRAERGRARELARAARGRRRARRPGRAARRTRVPREEFYVRTFAEPALDVNGIESGSPAPARRRSSRSAPMPTCRSGWLPASRSRRSPTRSSGCSGRPRRRAPSSTCELLAAAPPAMVPPDAKAIQLGLGRVRAGARRAAAADPLRRDACRSWPRSRTRGSRRSITGFSLPTPTSTRRTSGCSSSTCHSGSRPPARCSKISQCFKLALFRRGPAPPAGSPAPRPGRPRRTQDPRAGPPGTRRRR